MNERKEIFLAAYRAGAAHLASSFSLVEILRALWLDGVLAYDPINPRWDGRDILILSKGHGALALYVILREAGCLTKEELDTFCLPGSLLGGEPHVAECPWVETSTGSLGHGLGVAVGMALALKQDKKANRVYVILGDGECQEGSVWEGAQGAAAYGLDNLTVIIDRNRIQKMDLIENITGPDDLRGRFAAFGWDVKECDGHDEEALKAALTGPWAEGKPRCLMARTVKGKGASLMENAPGWHFRMPNRRELKVFCQELNITEEELEVCRRPI